MTSSVRQQRNIENFKAQQQASQQQHAEKQKQIEKDRALSEVFTRPSDVLKARCKQYTNDGADMMSNAIAQQDAFNSFRLALDEGGVELLPSGVQKILQVGLANKGSIELRDAETFMKVYEYLCELPGAFNRSDLIVAERTAKQSSTSAKVVEPHRNLADYTDEEIERIDGTKREGRTLLARIAEAKMLRDNIQPLLWQWVESLKAEPWNVELNSAQWDAVIRATQRLFIEHALPMIPKSFDLCRRVLSKEGIVLPSGMLTRAEQLSERIELTPNLSGDYSSRMDYVRESRRLHDAE